MDNPRGRGAGDLILAWRMRIFRSVSYYTIVLALLMANFPWSVSELSDAIANAVAVPANKEQAADGRAVEDLPVSPAPVCAMNLWGAAKACTRLIRLKTPEEDSSILLQYLESNFMTIVLFAC